MYLSSYDCGKNQQSSKRRVQSTVCGENRRPQRSLRGMLMLSSVNLDIVHLRGLASLSNVQLEPT